MTIQRYTDCTQLKVGQWINLLPYASQPVQITRILPSEVEVAIYTPKLIEFMPIKRKQISRRNIGWVCDTYEEGEHMLVEAGKLREELAHTMARHAQELRQVEQRFYKLAPQKFV